MTTTTDDDFRLDPQQVEATFTDCLFDTEAEANAASGDNVIKVEGIVFDAMLNREKLAEHRTLITQMLMELPEQVRKSGGGGWRAAGQRRLAHAVPAGRRHRHGQGIASKRHVGRAARWHALLRDRGVMTDTFAPWLLELDRRLLNGHTCAETHSEAIKFARSVEVPDRTIAKLLAAAVLRSNDEVEAFDETER